MFSLLNSSRILPGHSIPEHTWVHEALWSNGHLTCNSAKNSWLPSPLPCFSNGGRPGLLPHTQSLANQASPPLQAPADSQAHAIPSNFLPRSTACRRVGSRYSRHHLSARAKVSGPCKSRCRGSLDGRGEGTLHLRGLPPRPQTSVQP